MASGPCSSRISRSRLPDQLEGLVPGRLAELPVLLDERRGQPLGRVHELEAELALDAEVAVVGHAAGLGEVTRTMRLVFAVDVQVQDWQPTPQ